MRIIMKIEADTDFDQDAITRINDICEEESLSNEVEELG